MDDASSTDAPLTDPSSTDPSSSDAPSNDPSSTDASSTDAPSTDAPSTDAPSTDPPSTDSSSSDPSSTDSSSSDIYLINDASLNFEILYKEPLTESQIKYLESLSFTEEQITDFTQLEIDSLLNETNSRIEFCYNTYIKNIEPFDIYFNNFISSIKKNYTCYNTNDSIKNLLINIKILKIINKYIGFYLYNKDYTTIENDDKSIQYVINNRIVRILCGITSTVLI